MRRLPYATPVAGWLSRAACRGADTHMFFPVGIGDDAKLQTDAAKAVCTECPVRSPCLAWAMAIPQLCGIFGGFTEDERHALRHGGEDPKSCPPGMQRESGGPAIVGPEPMT